MTFIGSSGREQKNVRGAIVISEIVFVIAGPNDVVRDADFARERLEHRTILAVTDDHHSRARECFADGREGLQRRFKAAAAGELSDHGDEGCRGIDSVQRTYIAAVGSELMMVDRRRRESRVASANDEGLVDDE